MKASAKWININVDIRHADADTWASEVMGLSCFLSCIVSRSNITETLILFHQWQWRNVFYNTVFHLHNASVMTDSSRKLLIFSRFWVSSFGDTCGCLFKPASMETNSQNVLFYFLQNASLLSIEFLDLNFMKPNVLILKNPMFWSSSHKAHVG